MLWYKSWLDTRSRFLLGVVLLFVLACGTVFTFRTVQELAASLPPGAVVVDDDSLQAELQESLEAVRTFRGYAWSQWFAGNFPALLTLLAALLGSGSPLVKAGTGALFSLALPASRNAWIGTRAATGIAELLAVALLPSIAIVGLAPVLGERFSFIDALALGFCAFVGASLFFAIAVFLSTFFNDVWRPLLLTCLIAVVIAALGMALPGDRDLFSAMAGRSYYYSGSLPWPELVMAAAAAGAFIYFAAANIARRDF
jgi:hypothetical protein